MATAADLETTMKRWMTSCLAVLVLATVPGLARAIGPVIDWDPAYVWQAGGTPTNLPALGVMKVVGTVSQFGPPLAFLNPTMPATEYTFYVDNLVSLGTTSVGPVSTTIYTTPY